MILVGNKIITPSSNYLKINDQRVDLKQVFVVVVQRVVWKQPKESPGCLLNIYISGTTRDLLNQFFGLRTSDYFISK